ncbi:COMPASS (complex proteins associated with Set1p) component [Mucor velutinosus]|uniref:COMPASS (Complex proteins associated with Set1p) component n=1 Tax=Mucor velutinosus TaxID=708070 RepID=A0AAN7HWE7_9FUNG|nr:COMPASS (complex proteins associated with Set1p) component [Mucor velutinosus]
MSTIQKRGSIFTVILKPHNAAFQTRTLELKDKVKIRIGRQTSSKTAPTAFNGYFDSKVLSRQHAEIWCDRSKVYVKDVKSSNGTFVNEERLSNEGEESEPRELHDKDEIEFGIDILNDHGAIMYHKVSCSVYVFPVPLSQVDDGIIKELSNSHHVQVYPDPHSLVRKSSTSSISTLSSIGSDMTNGSSSTIAAMTSGGIASTGGISTGGTGGGGGGGVGAAAAASGKRSKKLESVLAKLQSEIEKSRHVENELKTIKNTVTDLDKVFSEDRLRKSDELQAQLNQAEATIKSYDEKWKYQNQTIQTAKNELHRFEKELDNSRSERDGIKQQLLAESQKVKDLEHRLEELSRQQPKKPTSATTSFSFLDAIQIKSIQILFAVLIGVISTLIYVLCN